MTASAGGSAPTPNWYPDPSDASLLRYWDGTQWTQHTSPAVDPQPAPPGPGGVAPRGGGSNKVLWIVLAAVAVVGVIAVVVVLVIAAVAVPVATNQQAKAAEAAAKADVSMLGKEIATWYVENTGAPPKITVRGGNYYLDGDKVGAVSQDVEFGDVSGTTSTDWCVWVTNPKGDVKDFEFSNMGGVQEGSC